MARKKTLVKIPFLKTKIRSKTISVIVGIILIAASLLLLISYFSGLLPGDSSGSMLMVVQENLVSLFGGMGLFVVVILFLLGMYAFTGVKKAVVQPLSFAGFVFVFFGLLGLLRTGAIGEGMAAKLSESISPLGSGIVFGTILIIGIVLFLDARLDAIIAGARKMLEGLFAFLQSSLPGKKDVQGKLDSPEALAGLGKKAIPALSKGDFIVDKKVVEHALRKPEAQERALRAIDPPEPKKKEQGFEKQETVVASDLYIKPLAPSTSKWVFPPLSLLDSSMKTAAERGDTKQTAALIEQTLDSFGIAARVVEFNEGPAVTQYGISIRSGIRLAKITALADNLALALAAPTGQVRIEAPIPGRSLVGIEIPNVRPEIVTLKRLLEHPLFADNPDPLLVPLGLDVSGNPQATSISKMPHCLIAGTTGSGKSVIMNAWISTLLFRTKPEDVRLILVDPKRVEMSLYNGIPHLLTPVINEQELAIKALKYTVKEMTNRYKLFQDAHARNLDSYNKTPGVVKLPYIILIIDELADLMMTSATAGDVETLITRIAQLARATGIHLVLATQRPSVNVITGLMKANIPTRLAFNVSSMIDSRVIIDMPGAEKLLGKGDMLFLPPDQAKPRRIQGPFVTEQEVKELTKFIKMQHPEVHYTDEIEGMSDGAVVPGLKLNSAVENADSNGKDPLFMEAMKLIMQTGRASTSYLQTRMKLGYSRANRIIMELEEAGFIGPPTGSGKSREILRRLTTEEIESGKIMPITPDEVQ